jgi:hypothetical protein
MNKTIYMTYKKAVPEFVFSRWTELNPDYIIDFNLDDDCINFLQEHFNDYIVNLFKKIPEGMYKADLWRLCKLYINGGVYADVDLVPYIKIDELDKDISFYSCLSVAGHSIFQAFMVNFSKPKNPLILNFLLSFLINQPYNFFNGPTFDMYNCIKYTLNNQNILPDKKYEIKEIKINVIIGRSDENSKYIDLHYFPNDISYVVKLKPNPYDDSFNFNIINNILIVTRTDQNINWEYNHSCDICIESTENVYLFKEDIGDMNNWIETAYISNNNVKILDSRDPIYYHNKGW